MSIYNLTGVKLFDKAAQEFYNNIDVDYEFDSGTGANYTVIRIYKRRTDGAQQYPFVFAPNGANAGTMSTLSMVRRNPWFLAINAGVFNTSNIKPDGVVIQNGVSVQNTPAAVSGHVGALPLTIDSNGNLSYAASDADTTTLISNGIISAVCGFCPIIVDYADFATPAIGDGTIGTVQAQRQIIGQFGNGDYAIVTCEGRGYDNSDGWTFAEARTICKKIGLKFAYNLDGGGSTETMLRLKPMNTIYEGTAGRIVPTFIVFNGSSEFSIPTEEA